MPERYDDWGNPIRASNHEPIEYSFRGLAKPLARTFREYRAMILWAIVALGLYLFWGSGEPRAPPIDWKQFAYVQYATDDHNMCNSFMVFEALHRLGSKAERVLMYPEEWNRASSDERNVQLLHIAERSYKVKLKPVRLINDSGRAKPGSLNFPSSWDTSINKLRAFELDEYDRVLHIDSGVTLRQHLDELFTLPKVQMAMPRAYWHDAPPGQQQLTSRIMLLEPNQAEFKNFVDILNSWKLNPDFKLRRHYDMQLVNHRFGGSAMVLPHRPYILSTSEFRRENHDAYLGVHYGPQGHLPARMKWDAVRAVEEAKLIYFDDEPLPKPWIMWPLDGLAEIQPSCGGSHLTCPERKVWKELYDDFRKRRRSLCSILSAPAPIWRQIQNKTETPYYVN